jgi:tetratricopeptide (TPR) repeat protein
MTAPINSELLDAQVPVLELVARNLPTHPQWAITLLDAVAHELVSPMLRGSRDCATDPSTAIEAGLKLAHRDPEGVEDWVTLAHLLAKAQRLNEALGWISRALELRPEAADYHRLRASLLERLGRLSEALEAARRASSLRPHDGELSADLERIEAAYTTWLRKVRDTSQDPPTAIEAGLELAHREPAPVDDWAALAHLLAKADRLHESLGWIERAAGLQPQRAAYHQLRASVLERLRLFKQAYYAARQAHSLDSGNLAVQADVKRTRKKFLARCLGLPVPA